MSGATFTQVCCRVEYLSLYRTDFVVGWLNIKECWDAMLYYWQTHIWICFYIEFIMRSVDALKVLTVHYASIFDAGTICITETASALYGNSGFLIVYAIFTTWPAIVEHIWKVDRALLRWFSYFINSNLIIKLYVSLKPKIYKSWYNNLWTVYVTGNGYVR